MKRSPLLVLFLLVLLGTLAAGCAPSTVEAALQATYTPVAEDATTAEDTTADADADTSDAQAAIDAAATEMAMLPEDSRPDSECIACHSNAEQLQLLAEEEEVQESLNEGSG